LETAYDLEIYTNQLLKVCWKKKSAVKYIAEQNAIPARKDTGSK